MPLPPHPTPNFIIQKKIYLIFFSHTKNMSNVTNQISFFSKKHNFSSKMKNENLYKPGIGFVSRWNSRWRLVLSFDSHAKVNLSSN
jgi:hypothetical protein